MERRLRDCRIRDGQAGSTRHHVFEGRAANPLWDVVTICFGFENKF